MFSGLPVIGIGGVSSADDVLQYVMAGATLVGVCTAGHLKGIDAYQDLIQDLAARMDELGISSLEDVRGLTIRRIEQRRAQGKVAVTEPVVPSILVEKCTSCRACERVCAYDAIEVKEPSGAEITPELCIGCGLCVSVCRFGAMHQPYYDCTML